MGSLVVRIVLQNRWTTTWSVLDTWQNGRIAGGARSVCQVSKIGVEQSLLVDRGQSLIENVAEDLEDNGALSVRCGLPDPFRSLHGEIDEFSTCRFKLRLAQVERDPNRAEALPGKVVRVA